MNTKLLAVAFVVTEDVPPNEAHCDKETMGIFRFFFKELEEYTDCHERCTNMLMKIEQMMGSSNESEWADQLYEIMQGEPRPVIDPSTAN